MVARWDLGGPVVVVVNRATEAILDSLVPDAAIVVVDEDGSSWASALSVGLDALTHLSPDAPAALVVDCDVPRIPAATVPALTSEFSKSGMLAAVPQYRYIRGGPVLVGRRLWDRLMASEEDQRLEDLFAAHPEWTRMVVISETAPVRVP